MCPSLCYCYIIFYSTITASTLSLLANLTISSLPQVSIHSFSSFAMNAFAFSSVVKTSLLSPSSHCFRKSMRPCSFFRILLCKLSSLLLSLFLSFVVFIIAYFVLFVNRLCESFLFFLLFFLRGLFVLSPSFCIYYITSQPRCQAFSGFFSSSFCTKFCENFLLYLCILHKLRLRRSPAALRSTSYWGVSLQACLLAGEMRTIDFLFLLR